MLKVKKILNNIIQVEGKNRFKINDFVSFENDTKGIVRSSKENEAYIIPLGSIEGINANSKVTYLKEDITIEFYKHYWGKIISPFGEVLEPYDFRIDVDEMELVAKGILSKTSPSILERQKINKSLTTGITLIDTLIPIGKGQRQLIIGNRHTGKTSIAMSTIINQRKKNVYSIYVAIGQKRNAIFEVYKTLNEFNALDKTTLIFANPAFSGEQYITPLIAMTMAESLMKQGKDVLIILDDLSKHAKICREISLSLNILPGRESFPNDLFYTHAYLLEKSGYFINSFNNGSITCLPIVEIIEEDLGDVISSNIISICDGLIMTDNKKYNKKNWPAINLNFSISRIGTAAQSPMIKNYSKQLHVEYAKLMQIRKNIKMGIQTINVLKKEMARWKGIKTLFTQFSFSGLSEEEMVILIILFKNNYLNEITDPHIFLKIFKNFCHQDDLAKLLVQKIKQNALSNNEILKIINLSFAPLINIFLNKSGGVISKHELEIFKGGSHA